MWNCLFSCNAFYGDIDQKQEGYKIFHSQEYPFVHGKEIHLRLHIIRLSVFLRLIHPEPIEKLRIEQGTEQYHTKYTDDDENRLGDLIRIKHGRRNQKGYTKKNAAEGEQEEADEGKTDM